MVIATRAAGSRNRALLGTLWTRSEARLQLLRVAAFVFVGYYLGARLGLALTFVPNPVSVLWPPNSVVFAALVLLPVRSWWVVAAAALPAHLLAEVQGGVPIAMVLCWFVSNMSEALIGAAMIVTDRYVKLSRVV